jgi:uncharacterized membrane protein
MHRRVDGAKRVRSLVLAALIAAIYVTLVLVLAPVSYLAIQVRIADALVGIVPLVGMPGVVGITIGVFIGNIASPLGPIDLISALPSFLGLLALLQLRKVSVMAGLLAYSFIVSPWVAFELSFILGVPYLLTFVYVAIGILIATAGLGYLLFKAAKRAFGKHLDW